MKIVISGKGGSGKSTILALFARQYANLGKRVLVVDTDESNIGLNRLLGMDAPPDLMEFFGGKKNVTEKIMGSLSDHTSLSFFQNVTSTNDLPYEYVTEKGMIRLVSIGKIHSFGEGCACPMGVLTRQFLSGLHLQKDEIVLTDTEAGIEHFGRGVEEGADLVIMILDPSYESVLLAEKVANMGEFNTPLYYILNKTDFATGSRLRDSVRYPEKIIGEIPQIPAIISAGLDGRIIDSSLPEITQIMDRLSVLKIAS